MPRLRMPTGHPRLWISPNQLPALRRAARTHRKVWVKTLLGTIDRFLERPDARRMAWRMHGRVDHAALGLGLAWRITGDKKYARAAEHLLETVHLWVSHGGGYDVWGMGAEAAAYLYDWFHDYWRATGQERRAGLLALRMAERALDDFLHQYIVDDWHNYALGLQAGALAGALALGRDRRDVDARALHDTLYKLHHGGYRYDDIRVQDAHHTPATTLCLDAWLNSADGAGFAMLGEATCAYHSVDVMEMVKFATWWTTAFGGRRQVWPRITDGADAFLYLQQPNGQYVRFGDSAGRGPHTRENDIMLHAHRIKPDPAYLDFLRAYNPPGSNPLPIHEVLCASKDLLRGKPRPTAGIMAGRPASRFMNPVSILRSGWDADATVVAFRCGRWGGGHQHLDMNGFTIYRGGRLAIDSGGYNNDSPYKPNYLTRTVAHNAILVQNPKEGSWLGRFGEPIANDGGQRPVVISYAPPNPVTGAPHPVLSEERRTRLRDEFDMGHTVAFESGAGIDYVAGDATRAYTYPWSGLGDNPSRRVEEAVRQLVFAKPDLVFVFDRVEAAQPSYTKTFLLHAVNAARYKKGARWVKAQPGLRKLPAGGPFEFEHEDGRLTVWPLMPAKRAVRSVGGKGYDYWLDVSPESKKGFNYACRNHRTDDGQWRIEISPTKPARRDCFVTVLHAGLKRQPRARNDLRFETASAKGWTTVRAFGPQDQILAEVAFREAGAIEVKAAVGGETLRHRAPKPQRVPRAKK